MIEQSTISSPASSPVQVTLSTNLPFLPDLPVPPSLRKYLTEPYDPLNPPFIKLKAAAGYLVQREFMDPDGTKEIRWCLQKLYNPHGSSPNTKAYIRAMGYRMPTKIDDPSKDTTGKLELQRLADETGDEVLKLTGDWREMFKTGMDYTSDKWMPGPDGRVHATFRWGTASGQLTAINPPVMTYPEHSGIAQRVKEAIKAELGHTLVKIDLRGYHARSIGWLANDPVYYKLADFDIHSFVTAHFLHLHDAPYLLDMDDDELRAALDHIKSANKHTRNYKVKRVTLGRQFGLQVRKLYLMHPSDFNPPVEQVIADLGEAKWHGWEQVHQLEEVARRGRAEAQKLFTLFDQLFPKVFVLFPQWVENQIRNVTPYRLVSPFGHWRFFWDLDLQQATAYLPSNIAHCHVQAALVRLHGLGAFRRYDAINFLHDALWLHPPDDLVRECVEVVQQELERPSEILVDSPLGPFYCHTDVEVGGSLSRMAKYE